MNNASNKSILWTELDAVLVWLYYVFMSLPWFLNVIFGGGDRTSLNNITEPVELLPLAFWVFGFTPLAFVCFLIYNRKKQSGCTINQLLHFPSAGTFFVVVQKGFLCGLCLFFLVTFLLKFWGNYLMTLGVEASPQYLVSVLKEGNIPLWQIIGLGGFLGIFAPFCEEIFYRGIIFERLKLHQKKWVAVFLSSLFFAVLHFNLFALPGVFIAGIGFALVYDMRINAKIDGLEASEKNGLLGSMVAHFTFNMLNFLMTLNFVVKTDVSQLP